MKKIIPGSGWSGVTSQPSVVGNTNNNFTDAEAIARWTTVPLQVIDSTFTVGVIAFHATGIQKVSFAVNGGEWIDVETPSLNTETNTHEYFISIDAQDFAVDGQIEIRAIAYPNFGVPTVLQGNYMIQNAGGYYDTSPAQHGYYSLYLFTNKNNTYTKPALYVSPTGNDTTGNGSETNPYKTLNKACIQFKSLYGSSSPGDNATIYCDAGTYTFNLKMDAFDAIKATNRWFTITPKSGITQDQVIIDNSTGERPKTRLIHLKNVTVKTEQPGATNSGLFLNGYTGSANHKSILWCDTIKLENPTNYRYSLTSQFANNTILYYTDCTMKEILNAFNGAILARNCTATYITSESYSKTQTIINCVCGHIDPGTTGGHHPDVFQWDDPSGYMRNVIIYGLRAYDAYTQGIFIANIPAAEKITNCAIVNYTMEGVGPSHAYDVFNDYIGRSDHLIVIGCTWKDQPLRFTGTSYDNCLFEGNCFWAVTSADDSANASGNTWRHNHYINSGGYQEKTYGTDVTTGDAKWDSSTDGVLIPASDSPLLSRVVRLTNYSDIRGKTRSLKHAVGSYERFSEEEEKNRQDRMQRFRAQRLRLQRVQTKFTDSELKPTDENKILFVNDIDTNGETSFILGDLEIGDESPSSTINLSQTNTEIEHYIFQKEISPDSCAFGSSYQKEVIGEFDIDPNALHSFEIEIIGYPVNYANATYNVFKRNNFGEFLMDHPYQSKCTDELLDIFVLSTVLSCDADCVNEFDCSCSAPVLCTECENGACYRIVYEGNVFCVQKDLYDEQARLLCNGIMDCVIMNQKTIPQPPQTSLDSTCIDFDFDPSKIPCKCFELLADDQINNFTWAPFIYISNTQSVYLQEDWYLDQLPQITDVDSRDVRIRNKAMTLFNITQESIPDEIKTNAYIQLPPLNDSFWGLTTEFHTDVDQSTILPLRSSSKYYFEETLPYISANINEISKPWIIPNFANQSETEILLFPNYTDQYEFTLINQHRVYHDLIFRSCVDGVPPIETDPLTAELSCGVTAPIPEDGIQLENEYRAISTRLTGCCDNHIVNKEDVDIACGAVSSSHVLGNISFTNAVWFDGAKFDDYSIGDGYKSLPRLAVVHEGSTYKVKIYAGCFQKPFDYFSLNQSGDVINDKLGIPPFNLSEYNFVWVAHIKRHTSKFNSIQTAITSPSYIGTETSTDVLEENTDNSYDEYDGHRITVGTGFDAESTLETNEVGVGYKPTARWTTIPFQTFDRTINVGLVAFHYTGIQRVEISANNGPWISLSEMSENPTTNNKEYWVHLEAPETDQLIEFRAKIIPVSGETLILQNPDMLLQNNTNDSLTINDSWENYYNQWFPTTTFTGTTIIGDTQGLDTTKPTAEANPEYVNAHTGVHSLFLYSNKNKTLNNFIEESYDENFIIYVDRVYGNDDWDGRNSMYIGPNGTQHGPLNSSGRYEDCYTGPVKTLGAAVKHFRNEANRRYFLYRRNHWMSTDGCWNGASCANEHPQFPDCNVVSTVNSNCVGDNEAKTVINGTTWNLLDRKTLSKNLTSSHQKLNEYKYRSPANDGYIVLVRNGEYVLPSQSYAKSVFYGTGGCVTRNPSTSSQMLNWNSSEWNPNACTLGYYNEEVKLNPNWFQTENVVAWSNQLGSCSSQCKTYGNFIMKSDADSCIRNERWLTIKADDGIEATITFNDDYHNLFQRAKFENLTINFEYAYNLLPCCYVWFNNCTINGSPEKTFPDLDECGGTYITNCTITTMPNGIGAIGLITNTKLSSLTSKNGFKNCGFVQNSYIETIYGDGEYSGAVQYDKSAENRIIYNCVFPNIQEASPFNMWGSTGTNTFTNIAFVNTLFYMQNSTNSSETCYVEDTASNILMLNCTIVQSKIRVTEGTFDEINLINSIYSDYDGSLTRTNCMEEAIPITINESDWSYGEFNYNLYLKEQGINIQGYHTLGSTPDIGAYPTDSMTWGTL
jgi:hypothetical protein